MTITADLSALGVRTWAAQAPNAATDAHLPTALLARVAASKAASAAEALRELRAAFPDTPLPVRVAALAGFRRSP